MLGWIESNLGCHRRGRTRCTAGRLRSPGPLDELWVYAAEQEDDFLPALVWLLAAVVALHDEDDPGWPRRLNDQAATASP